MSIKEALLNWDGKSAKDIGRIYELNLRNTTFVSELIPLLKEKQNQIGASWLFKKHLEEGNILSAKTVSDVCKQLDSLSDWGPRLHILQTIPFMSFSESDKELVEEFLRNCISDKNKFVRAWSYGGFYLLADQFPEYRLEAMQFIDGAMIDESAAVKARIRTVTRNGFLAGKY